MAISDWIGFIGVFLLLLAYALSAIDKLSTNNLSYILMNLIGAALGCFASCLLHFVPFVILEGAWMIVSGISLFRYIRKNSFASSKSNLDA